MRFVASRMTGIDKRGEVGTTTLSLDFVFGFEMTRSPRSVTRVFSVPPLAIAPGAPLGQRKNGSGSDAKANDALVIKNAREVIVQCIVMFLPSG